ncbi:MAG: hypothetical protein ACOYT8_06075 [Candidatus Dependentiae bacterium]
MKHYLILYITLVSANGAAAEKYNNTTIAFFFDHIANKTQDEFTFETSSFEYDLSQNQPQKIPKENVLLTIPARTTIQKIPILLTPVEHESNMKHQTLYIHNNKGLSADIVISTLSQINCEQFISVSLLSDFPIRLTQKIDSSNIKKIMAYMHLDLEGNKLEDSDLMLQILIPEADNSL